MRGSKLSTPENTNTTIIHNPRKDWLQYTSKWKICRNARVAGQQLQLNTRNTWRWLEMMLNLKQPSSNVSLNARLILALKILPSKKLVQPLIASVL